MIIGYTTGTYDLFHYGHVEFLKKAKSMCDKLIVGVTSDELGFEEKNKYPIISIQNRIKVIESCKYVDLVVVHNDKNGDKITPYKKFKFDYVFIGDDYTNDPSYTELNKFIPVKVIFLPYTNTISSSKIREKINK